MNSNKVLIVGGAGYIGGQVAFASPLWDVYDNLTFENYFYLPNHFIYGDVRDHDKLKSILEDYDVIIWLAAVVGDGACNLNPLLTLDVNENSVKWLVDNFKGRIVFASSCSVYGAYDDMLNETSGINPLSLYANTKVNCEKILLKHNNSIILRFGTIFGHAIRPRFDLVVNILTAQAYLNKEIKVFGGEQWRPNVHVEDISSAIIASVYSDKVGVFNISNENLKIIDIAELVKKRLPETKITITKSPFEDNRNYKVDNSLAKDNLNWFPKYKVSYGVDQIVDVLESGRVPNPFDPIFHNLNYMANSVEISKKNRYGG